METIRDRVARARNAGRTLATIDAETRNNALIAIADALETCSSEVDAANGRDLEQAEAGGLAAPLYKRLKFGADKRAQSARGLRAISKLQDPIGRILGRRELDEGLILTQRTAPIGVIAMIFESRPDALVQIAGLALKSGNALVLKGGSEAAESNRTLADLIGRASVGAGLPEGWIQLVETREDVRALLDLSDLIDLMIPRGSNEFVRYIMDHTSIPVLGHADGICHLFLDRAADPGKSVALTLDSKTQYVAVCNAIETLLVDAEAAPTILPAVAEALTRAGVELRGCPRSRELVPSMQPAAEADWSTEYLDMILAVRVVDGLDAAVEHINHYGSGHTDGIVTEDSSAATRFLDAVDSASVMWNASTRFADGFRYGLGAEVGISTSRIHARGPVGLDGLVTYKWLLEGSGQIVDDYSNGRKSFTHRDISAE